VCECECERCQCWCSGCVAAPPPTTNANRCSRSYDDWRLYVNVCECAIADRLQRFMTSDVDLLVDFLFGAASTDAAAFASIDAVCAGVLAHGARTGVSLIEQGTTPGATPSTLSERTNVVRHELLQILFDALRRSPALVEVCALCRCMRV
jgi:hypothetical protein